LSATPAPNHFQEQSNPVRKPKNPTPRKSSRKSAFTKVKFQERETWKAGSSQEPTRQLSPQEVANINETEMLCAELMAALDSNDTSTILAKARTLINHPNPEVRIRVLDALDWAGNDALLDLANMLDDENSGIADAATERFWEQVADLPNDPAKLNLLNGLAQNQDPDMLPHLAEELANYHPHVAYDLIQSILSASPKTVNEDIQWELEGMTGESFETATEWQKWFIENKSTLEADYEEQDF